MRLRAVFLLPALISGLFFLVFQARGIWAGDSGDLVTAAALGGVPHPPGYPLYSLLGFLLNTIPVMTTSWRITLLSSIPQALSVGLISAITYLLTAQPLAAFFAALLALGNYVFFLYGVTPEVFGLLDLFILTLTFLLTRWFQTRKSSILLWASFVFGLSLSHHHVILFFVPAAGYWLYQVLKSEQWKLRTIVSHLLAFAGGLLPYIYLPIAGMSQAIINWDRPTTFANFWRLVTRADYGSFTSNLAYGSLPVQRFLSLKAYGEFAIQDFGWAGIIIAILGAWWIWQQRKKYFGLVVGSILVLGPLFLFYASFALVGRFTLGTFERFLLPSYSLLFIAAGCGFVQAMTLTQSLARRLQPAIRRLVPVTLGGLLFLYTGLLIARNMHWFWGLPQDVTAQNVGVDALRSTEPNALVLLAGDTILFTTQYVRYALQYRPDTIVVHTSRLESPDYQQLLHENFPQLSVPVSAPGYIQAFLKANLGKMPIYSTNQLAVDASWIWIPEGLLFRLTPEEDIPSTQELLARNNRLWEGFQDPGTGILARHEHLMLSDVRNVYSAARINLSRTLLRAGDYQEAKVQLQAAISLAGDNQLSAAYRYLGLTHLFSGECVSALSAFQASQNKSLAPEPDLALYMATTYSDCLKDPVQAKQWMTRYELLKAESETPLEGLPQRE